ncbi:MAG: hypothetical protein ACR5LD_10575 [Symbiopectobacterium sp.]
MLQQVRLENAVKRFDDYPAPTEQRHVAAGNDFHCALVVVSAPC